MGIGTSKGAFYRDEGHYHASQWDDRYDDNIVSPQELEDRSKYVPNIPLEVKDVMPFPDNKNPTETFDSRFGTLPPSGIMNDMRRPKGDTVPLVRKINDMADDPSNALNFNTRPTVFEKNIGEFNNWLNFNSQKMGRDLTKDFQNYDLTGYWLKHGNVELGPGEHLTDEFKKPNHPTFSTESKYHQPDVRPEDKHMPPGMAYTAEGGQWGKDDKGKDTFTPGRTNFDYYTTQEMIDYFKKYEPNAQLILPGT